MSDSARFISSRKELALTHHHNFSSLTTRIKDTSSVQSRNYKLLLDRAKDYYNSGQLSAAMEHLSKALYYELQNPQINYMLGVIYLSHSQYHPALKHFQVVLKQSQPLYRDRIWLLAGIACHRLKDSQAALSHLSKHIESNGNTIEGYFYRARIHCDNRNHSLALADLQEIIGRLSPSHEPALRLKIKCLKDSKLHSQCVLFIEECLASDEYSRLKNQLTLEKLSMYYEVGDYGKAWESMSQAEKNSEIVMSCEAMLLKARILMKMNKSNEAILIFDDIIAQPTASNQVYLSALLEIALLYMKLRDFYQAFSYLKRTHPLPKNKLLDDMVRLAEGVTFLMKKKFAEGLLLVGAVEQSSFATLEAEHSTFLMNLKYNSMGFAQFSLGEHGQALQAYRLMDLSESNTETHAIKYNMALCEGVASVGKENPDLVSAMRHFHAAQDYLARPEAYFYSAVLTNMANMKDRITTEGFVEVLQLLEEGLKKGESAHMYFYRSMIYLFLGMSAESLEDIDRAIEKSEDNIAKFFHVRGVIFMLDKNYEQAAVEFGTALSIDEDFQESIIEKAKCLMLSGDAESAHAEIVRADSSELYRLLFELHQKNYREVMMAVPSDQNEPILQVASFMSGKFDQAGPSGKLVLATIYENYHEVVKLVSEAVELNVGVGCLETQDLLGLKGYCLFKTAAYELALSVFVGIEEAMRENSRNVDYTEQEERRILFCRLNVILIHFVRDDTGRATALLATLLEEICEGPIYDQLSALKLFLDRPDQHEHEFDSFQHLDLLSDFFADESHRGLKFRLLLPFPNYRVTEVEYPRYEHLLTDFQIKDIENKPEAPWIKRGQFGVIFTDDIREFENLNLQTEENESRARLVEDLRLGSAVLEKISRMARKSNSKQNNQS